jgi:site-specific DNA-methyltransferase (adenine-specific)
MSSHLYTLHAGDCAEVLKTLAPNSIEAAVSDPPYGLGDMSPARVADCLSAWARGEAWTPTGKGFMGKEWDAWTPGPEMWRELYRVLKPGAHALIFAGSRTQDIMSIALRLAGFEVRDSLQWLYGSGFPKNHDVSKAIDKNAGAEREVIGTKLGRPGYSLAADKGRGVACVAHGNSEKECEITAPATDAARAWEGWGSALKPAYEPIILARKPLDGTLAQNTLTHGCGGLNIDGGRVGEVSTPTQGRYPANILLDEAAAELLDAQTGEPTSRFFYCAKASSAEREAGLEGREARAVKDGRKSYKDSPHLRGETLRLNTHPTIKPLALMRYLVRLITPPGATCIDPFMGSGSTGCAVMQEGEGRRFVGIEREPEYLDIARARLAHYTPADTSPDEEGADDEQLSLF